MKWLLSIFIMITSFSANAALVSYADCLKGLTRTGITSKEVVNHNLRSYLLASERFIVLANESVLYKKDPQKTPNEYASQQAIVEELNHLVSLADTTVNKQFKYVPPLFLKNFRNSLSRIHTSLQNKDYRAAALIGMQIKGVLSKVHTEFNK